MNKLLQRFSKDYKRDKRITDPHFPYASNAILQVNFDTFESQATYTRLSRQIWILKLLWKSKQWVECKFWVVRE